MQLSLAHTFTVPTPRSDARSLPEVCVCRSKWHKGGGGGAVPLRGVQGLGLCWATQGCGSSRTGALARVGLGKGGQQRGVLEVIVEAVPGLRGSRSPAAGGVGQSDGHAVGIVGYKADWEVVLNRPVEGTRGQPVILAAERWVAGGGTVKTREGGGGGSSGRLPGHEHNYP